MFPAAVEDPVLLDAERQRINPALRCSSDRIDEAVHGVLARLAVVETAPGGEVCLSYSCRDLREYRETFPSWLMLQAYRLQTAIRQVVSRSEGRAWRAEVLRAGIGGGRARRRRLVAARPEARGRARRSRPSCGSFRRWRRGSAPRRRARRRRSASSTASCRRPASCSIRARGNGPPRRRSCRRPPSVPFRHFLERGLGLQAVDEGDRDSDVWLDPMLRGTELHDLYAEMLAKCRDEKRRPNLGQDWRWLRDRTNARLTSCATRCLRRLTKCSNARAPDFLADVELFLRPSATSKTAGRRSASRCRSAGCWRGQHEPLAQAEPIVIDLGNGLRFRLAGRIDRIDQIGPSSFEIIDYKTGGYCAADWKGRLRAAVVCSTRFTASRRSSC